MYESTVNIYHMANEEENKKEEEEAEALSNS